MDADETPEKFVNLAKVIIIGAYCQVYHEGQLTECFEIGTGV